MVMFGKDHQNAENRLFMIISILPDLYGTKGLIQKSAKSIMRWSGNGIKRREKVFEVKTGYSKNDERRMEDG